MKIISLVENTSTTGMKTAHGLSLYIETASHKLLFDLGPDSTIFENAEKLGIDLKAVDTVIISHGHFDHGGALKDFLDFNDQATIYIQENAFKRYYRVDAQSPDVQAAISEGKYIGLDAELKNNPRFQLLHGDFRIDDELMLLTIPTGSANTEPSIHPDHCHSDANDVLWDEHGPDSFGHEQNLLIIDSRPVLIVGCGHSGIVNIMNMAAEYKPYCVIGGFHLFDPSTGRTISEDVLDNIAAELKKYHGTSFFTCHCTGPEAFEYLSRQIPLLNYLACGDEIIF